MTDENFPEDSPPETATWSRTRLRAGDAMREKPAPLTEIPDSLSLEEARRLLHELQAHRIELERQNDELRRTQAELEVSRARYFDLYDQAPVGYFTLSEHGLILEANRAAATLLETARDAMIRQPLSRFIRLEDQDLYSLYRRRHLASAAPQVLELRLLRQGTAHFWAKLESNWIQTADGERMSRVVVSDITGSKQAESQLALVSFGMDHVREAAYLIDENSRFRYVNEYACRISGYSHAELLNMGVSNLNPEYSVNYWHRHWRELKAVGSLTFEAFHRNKDGRIFPVEITANYFEYEGRAYNLVLLRDITERKQVEKALIEKGAFLRSIYENIQAAIFVVKVSPAGEFRYAGWNAAAESMIGIKSDQALGLGPEEVFGPVVGKRILENYTRCIQQASCTYEECFTLDKGDLWTMTTLTVMRNLAGQSFQIVGFAYDITERKKTEEQLRRMTSVATLAEQNERKAIARDLHDGLGQILHIAKMKLDTLANIEPKCPNHHHLEDLDVLITNASGMVRSLTSQLNPPVLETLGLIPALFWLAEEMEHLYGLVVEVVDDGAPKLLTPVQATILFRAVRELLINVAKHAGVVHARVLACSDVAGLYLVVEDSGVGISNVQEVLDGMGSYGLASVLDRITYLGGTLEIRTPPEGGTLVRLWMPFSPLFHPPLEAAR